MVLIIYIIISSFCIMLLNEKLTNMKTNFPMSSISCNVKDNILKINIRNLASLTKKKSENIYTIKKKNQRQKYATHSLNSEK